MGRTLATLVVALGLGLLAGSAEARDAAAHRHGVPVAGHHDKGARFHHMQKLQRKHDMRRLHHDKRQRRPMRSM